MFAYRHAEAGREIFAEIPLGGVVKLTVPQSAYAFEMTGPDSHHLQEWLNIQNGRLPTDQLSFDHLPCYIRNGRDLGEYVHRDFSFQAPLAACLILLSLGQDALASTNPYLFSPTQVGFTTFGSPHFLDFATKAARAALEAAWFQKLQYQYKQI